ncbi:hypothetical protein BST45_10080 [Mycobacterium shinjukuense]|nr:hypothetical protein BST45_10080 [Mycobacterium shinjukuense]
MRIVPVTAGEVASCVAGPEGPADPKASHLVAGGCPVAPLGYDAPPVPLGPDSLTWRWTTCVAIYWKTTLPRAPCSI